MIITLDIETKSGLKAQPDNFLIGCVLKDTGKHTFFKTPNEMWDYIINLGKSLNKFNKKLYVYSANHTFDWMLYAPIKHPNVVQVSKKMFLKHYIESPSDYANRCTQMSKEGRPTPKEKRSFITFLDIFSVYNSSIRKNKCAGVKRIGELINLPKYETPKELLDKSYTNYDFLDMNKISEYCLRDTEIVMEAIKKVKSILKDEKVRVNTLYTIHQVAMNRMLNKLRRNECELLTQNPDSYVYELPKPKYPAIINRGGEFHSAFCRGGIVQAYKQGVYDDCIKIDCNGFWQWSISNIKMPDLRTEYKVDSPLKFLSTKDLFKKIGYSLVTIKVPDCTFGCLPVRVKVKGQTHNKFPNNESIIIGHYTNNEIKYAITQGYRVLDVEYSVLWEPFNSNPFRKIVSDTYFLRKGSKSEFNNWFYKQMGNSFVGKFAQCYPITDIKTIDIKEVDYYIKIGYQVIDTFDRYYTVQRTLKLRYRPYFAPIMYALTTSNARIEHHKVINKFSKDQVLYVDTDSLILTNTKLKEINSKVEISNELGAWKVENKKGLFGFLPEKCEVWKEKYYSFGDEYHMSGVPMPNIIDFISNKDKSSIIRNRMITDKMSKDINLIGTQKEEIINLDYKCKPDRKVYIDEYVDYNSRLVEEVYKFIR